MNEDPWQFGGLMAKTSIEVVEGKRSSVLENYPTARDLLPSLPD